MLYLRSWLEDYINLDKVSEVELLQLISTKSGEVEDSWKVRDFFHKKVVIGKITNLRQHPNADRLKVFDVDLGNKKIQIVSAAPNAVDGLICPVALVGASLPGMVITEKIMRGEKSQGMCLGQSEIMLETGMSHGLWQLNELLTKKKLEILDCLGKPIAEILPEYFTEEIIYDIKYLADKYSYCSSHLGLAFELAGVLGDHNLLTPVAKKLLFWDNFSKKNLLYKYLIESQSQSQIDLEFTDDTGFSNTFGLYELDLNKKFDCPYQILKRMFLIEQNIIGSSVDLSNYLLRDIGQPSHFFDLDKVITANKNSKKLKWNIKKLTKPANFEGLGQLKNTVIPQGLETINQQVEGQDQILTIPGISGGQSTKVEYQSQRILIEVASFIKERTSQASFKLGYRSDGSRFWNSGVKIALQFIWLERFLEILEKYKIDFSLKVVAYWTSKKIQKKYDLAPKKIFFPGNLRRFLEDLETNSIIKVDFDYIVSRLDNRPLSYWQAQIENKLNLVGKLNLENFYANVFYNNLESQEDLVFEVARLYGLNNLQNQYLINYSQSKLKNHYDLFFSIKELATQYNFNEIVSRPFINKHKLFSYLTNQRNEIALEAISSQRQDENFLQDSLFSNLFKAAVKNLKMGHKNLRLFETNNVYILNPKNNKVQENKHFDLVMIDDDPYILTSFIYNLVKNLKLQIEPEESQSEWQNLGKSVIYKILGNTSETIDYDKDIQKYEFTQIELVEIKNSIKKDFDLPLAKKAWYLHLQVDPKLKFDCNPLYFDETEYSIIRRSYSFFVNTDLKWQKVKTKIQNSKLKETKIFVMPIERLNENGKDIINFEVEFMSYTKTLNSQEIQIWEENTFAEIKAFGLFEQR